MPEPTVTIPAQSGVLLGDIPGFREAVDSFSAVLDQIDAGWPQARRVPAPLIAALDMHRQVLISLGRTRLGVVVAR